MIRKFTAKDRELYIRLADAFYHTAGVLKPIPRAYFERTFDEMMRSDVYAEGYLVVDDLTGEPAGYGLLAKTFSQEAGGVVVWMEEGYIRPEYQRRGYGSALIAHMEHAHPEARRFRGEIEPDNIASKTMMGRMGYQPLGYDAYCKDVEP